MPKGPEKPSFNDQPKKGVESEKVIPPKGIKIDADELQTKKVDQKERARIVSALEDELPVEKFARYDMRIALYNIWNNEKLATNKTPDWKLPVWVFENATGELLYNQGWDVQSLRQSIIDWQKFIDDTN